ncbi:MAG: MFS transporter [Myxococcales bacterium]|nr:MFS transporter [Myxococcales bacterium]
MSIQSVNNPPATPAQRPSESVSGTPATAGFPPGVPYIVGNEAAERFSYYGMRAVLWIYMVALFTRFLPPGAIDAASKLAAESKATARVHLFFAGVYAFPMIGALIADRLLGKYRVIIWLSLVYCAGHAVLAFAAGSESGLYLGLALIAIGSGGIKPCVSANVGDQFTAANSHLVSKIYQIFYFSINFGSFFSTLLTPWLYYTYGPEWAFGVPGVLMLLATGIFWLGSKKFVKVPPRPGGSLGALDAIASVALFMPFAIFVFGGTLSFWVKLGIAIGSLAVWFALFTVRQSMEIDRGFISTVVFAIRNQHLRKPGMGFFDVVRERLGDEAAEGPPAVMRIAVVFSMVSVFWALFDQHSSSWVNQATKMNLGVDLPLIGHLQLKAAQLAALNPLMVMLIIPLLNFAVYPVLESFGLKLTPLRKMATGMFLAAFAFAAVALLQARIDTAAAVGEKVGALWQVIPYLILTTAEVLVSATGLEFAYTQAPRSMKSTIMGFWLLTVTVGNLLVTFVAGFEKLPLVIFFWIFALLMGVAAAVFAVLAYFYKGKTYLQHGG